MKIEQRDTYVCQDYSEGKEINELSRSYGLSERRVSQILQTRGVPRRPRRSMQRKTLSQEHIRLGVRLHTFRFDRGIETSRAATDLGWSTIHLRKIERGTTTVELLDLLDIASYLGITIGELMEKSDG